MNAYELADYLDYKLEDVFSHHQDTIVMLRQQADRIVELEKGIQGTVGYHCYQAGLQKSADRIAELEKTIDLVYKFMHERCLTGQYIIWSKGKENEQ